MPLRAETRSVRIFHTRLKAWVEKTGVSPPRKAAWVETPSKTTLASWIWRPPPARAAWIETYPRPSSAYCPRAIRCPQGQRRLESACPLISAHLEREVPRESDAGPSKTEKGGAKHRHGCLSQEPGGKAAAAGCFAAAGQRGEHSRVRPGLAADEKLKKGGARSVSPFAFS